MKMEYAKKMSIRDFTLYNIGLDGSITTLAPVVCVFATL
jgi:hypothetical protein